MGRDGLSSVREQHLQIIWRSLSQSLQPLLDPTQRATHSLSEILLGPLGMFTGQAAQSGPIGTQLSLAESEKRGVDLATKLGFTGDDALTKLRAVPDGAIAVRISYGNGDERTIEITDYSDR